MTISLFGLFFIISTAPSTDNTCFSPIKLMIDSGTIFACFAGIFSNTALTNTEFCLLGKKYNPISSIDLSGISNDKFLPSRLSWIP